MATIGKEERPGSGRAHNGHSKPAARVHAVGSREPGLLGVGRLGRELPRRMKALFESNPVAVLAAVGAGGFVLGALLGSRAGRLVILSAIPHAVERVFEGAVGQTIADYARSLADGGDARS